MTYAQWLAMAEIYALKEKREREERDEVIKQVYKASLRGMREMLIRILGLNIGAGAPEKSQDGEEPHLPYLPFISIMAKPEVMEELLKREEEGQVATDVLNDENIDQLSEQLMHLDLSDLEPILRANAPPKDKKWTSDDAASAMKFLGISQEPEKR